MHKVLTCLIFTILLIVPAFGETGKNKNYFVMQYKFLNGYYDWKGRCDENFKSGRKTNGWLNFIRKGNDIRLFVFFYIGPINNMAYYEMTYDVPLEFFSRRYLGKVLRLDDIEFWRGPSQVVLRRNIPLENSHIIRNRVYAVRLSLNFTTEELKFIKSVKIEIQRKSSLRKKNIGQQDWKTRESFFYDKISSKYL